MTDAIIGVGVAVLGVAAQFCGLVVLATSTPDNPDRFIELMGLLVIFLGVVAIALGGAVIAVGVG